MASLLGTGMVMGTLGLFSSVGKTAMGMAQGGGIGRPEGAALGGHPALAENFAPGEAAAGRWNLGGIDMARGIGRGVGGTLGTAFGALVGLGTGNPGAMAVGAKLGSSLGGGMAATGAGMAAAGHVLHRVGGGAIGTGFSEAAAAQSGKRAGAFLQGGIQGAKTALQQGAGVQEGWHTSGEANKMAAYSVAEALGRGLGGERLGQNFGKAAAKLTGDEKWNVGMSNEIAKKSQAAGGQGLEMAIRHNEARLFFGDELIGVNPKGGDRNIAEGMTSYAHLIPVGQDDRAPGRKVEMEFGGQNHLFRVQEYSQPHPDVSLSSDFNGFFYR